MSPGRAGLFGLVALLVAAAALWLSSQRQLPQATLVGALVLPGLAADVNEVDAIHITRGAGTRATLQRQENGEWQVAERGYRADVTKLRRLLLDCAALAIVEEKTHDPANYAALGVDAPATTQSQGTLLQIHAAHHDYQLLLGRNSGMKTAFVRVPTEAASALATPQLALDANPATWLDHQLLDLAPERVKEVTRKPAPPPPAKNAPPPPADPSFVALAFDDVRTTPDRAEPSAQLVIETKDGMIVELAGLREGDKAFLAVSAHALESAAPAVHREASELVARTANRQFELPVYRYETFFPPKPAAPPATAKKAGAAAKKR
jgi:Domain of unknown function (DUF4340)